MGVHGQPGGSQSSDGTSIFRMYDSAKLKETVYLTCFLWVYHSRLSAFAFDKWNMHVLL